MKRALVAILVIFAVAVNPVLAKALDCCDMPSHTHAGKTDSVKSQHPDNHCCHVNTVNIPETHVDTVMLKFTSSKFAITQIELRSLFKPSPLLEPPSQV